MTDASSTSPYILAAPDSTLPNSRNLLAAGGLITQDTGGEGTLTINTVGNLKTVNELVAPGILVCDTTVSPTILPRQLVAGAGITITYPDGQGNNPVIAVANSSTLQNVNVYSSNGTVLGSTRSSLSFTGSGSVSVTVADSPTDDPTFSNVTITGIVAADVNAQYIIQQPDISLPNSQALSPLTTGLLKVTNGTGVLSTAVANSDYQAASTELTSISAITPSVGSLIVGNNNTTYTGLAPSSTPGTVLTSNGTSGPPSWAAPATGNLTVILGNNVTQALVGNTTYIATNTVGNPVTFFILPTAPTVGDFYQIIGVNGVGWHVTQNGSQQIAIGTTATTPGILGYIESTTTGPSGFQMNDSVILYCITTNLFACNIISGTIYVN